MDYARVHNYLLSAETMYPGDKKDATHRGQYQIPKCLLDGQPGQFVKQKAVLNKPITDQVSPEFRRKLEYKSRWRGGMVMAVQPHQHPG